MREELKEDEEALRVVDQKEHQRAKIEGKTIDRREVEVDAEKIREVVHKHQMEQHHEKVDKMLHESEGERREARERLHEMHDSIEKDGMYNMQRLGVHEMINGRDVKVAVDKIKGHLKKGLPRGGEAFHGEVGQPLSGEARNGLLGMFGLVILVGFSMKICAPPKKALSRCILFS